MTTGDERPDETLLRQFQDDPGGTQGRAAVSELLGRYRKRVYLWCFRFVRHHDQALDLAQEVLISAYRALPGFEGRSRFSSWLFAIAHNRCVSAGRAARLPRDEEVDLATLVDPAPGPESALDERQREEAMLELIRRHLDPVEQDALWLRGVERMGVDDITRVLGITMSSGARGVLQSARRKLRAALEREAGEGRET